MSLQKDALRAALRQGLSDLSSKKGVTLSDVKKVWNQAYLAYAATALPVGGLPTALFVPTSGIADGLSGVPGSFVADLAVGLQKFWSSGQWAPDTKFRYQTSSAAGFFSPTMTRISADLDQAVDGIAQDLHSYTTSAVVLAATSLVSGVTTAVLVI